jgi:alginate O-acetyltransferase complex protein AlgI
MIFNEALYPLFLLLAVTVFFSVPIRWRAGWLMLSGLAFYSYYAGTFVVLFGGEALLIWLLMKYGRTRRSAFIAGLLLSLAVLAVYKYRQMALATWYQCFPPPGGPPTPETLILPLAISFFTFEFIHYLIEMRRGTLEPHSLSELMAFMLFFPTMIAGPIKRFQGFVPQILSARLSVGDVQIGLQRILIGTAKKTLMADSLDLWTAPLYRADLAQVEPLTLWVALLAYALKIYTDFSGYSDIAIGSARLFGLHVPENFDWPYLQPNIALFWRHWHISLTSWITDYVFKPLGGSRTGFALALLNTLIAMAVSGIWHGAAWHFVFWGLYHGVLLGLHRIWREKLRPHWPALEKFPRLYRGVCTGLTFLLVTLGWGLFILPLDRFGQLLLRLF